MTMDAKLQELCRQAHEDRIRVGMLDTDTKNRTLELAADALMAHEQEILEANAIDMERGRERNMPQGLLDRLKLDHDRLLGMADGLRQVAKLEDPIGEVMSMRKRPNGLIIGKVRVAIGVVGIIFEARPNVTSDAFGLCFKSGNCAILKGGSDAIHSNIAIVSAMQEALRRMNIPKGALSLIESTDRETTNAFMKMKDYVDLLIPRGGRGLIQSVVNNATIPVIETGTGNCHVYVDQFADQEMAVNIIKNAKTQRIGVCNACESIVVHRAIAKEFLPKLYAALKEYDVEMRGDSYAVECLGPDQPLVKDATEEDWGTEYLDYIMSVKIVDSLDEAIAHINKYNTSHRTAVKLVDNCQDNVPVVLIQSHLIYLKQIQCKRRHLIGNLPVILYLGKITHPLEQTVCQTGSSPGTAGKLVSAFFINFHIQYLCRLQNNRAKFLHRIIFHVADDTKTVAKRCRKHSGPCRSPDKRKLRKIQPDGTGGFSFSDHHVNHIIFHCRIQYFLHLTVQPVNFVHKQNVTFCKVIQDRRHLSRFCNCRSRGHFQVGTHLICNDPCKRCLSKSRWSIKQYMVQRLLPGFCRLNVDFHI